MSLIYKGTLPEHINNIPARDLSDAELNELIANGTAKLVCGKEVSLAEFEGILMQGKLYVSVPKKAIARDMDILEKKEEN